MIQVYKQDTDCLHRDVLRPEPNKIIMSIAGNECILDFSEAFRNQMQIKDILCSRQVSDISCKLPQVLVVPSVHILYQAKTKESQCEEKEKKRRKTPRADSVWGEQMRGKKRQFRYQ